MSNKELKEKIIKQKYETKTEIASAKTQLYEMMKKIQVEQTKARLKTQKLMQDLKKEKIQLRNMDRAQKLKEKKKIVNQNSLIAKNKELLLKAKKGLKDDLNLIKIDQKNVAINQKKKCLVELQKIKLEIRLEKQAQKEKLIQVKNNTLENKNKLQKQLIKKNKNNKALILQAEDELNKKRADILKKKADVAIQRKKNRENAKAKIMERIVKAKAEKKELKLKRIKTKNKHNERLLILKGKKLIANEDSIYEIKELEKNVEDTKNNIKKEKIYYEDRKIEINESANDELNNNLSELADSNQMVFQSIHTKESFVQNISRYEKNLIKGTILNKVGKRERKIYDKYNSNNIKKTLAKLKVSEVEKELIIEMIKLKDKDSLIDLREFAKYAAYMTDTEIKDEDVESQVVAQLANVLMKKTLQMLDGYFKLEKVGKYKLIKWNKNTSSYKSNIISLPQNDYSIMFQKVLKEKLKKGAIVKISNNVAIKLVNKEVIVLHDIAFIR
ncbi:hypothetical protein [Candidatus Mycoplasma mahonii]|uniref:hypothetical protein n=1 Tax=Candidatus Mycoplasma mahonii TaxID=3004105 RepID=UPI0026F05B19|nr:hypothetical protein [Candidatus Mycoplasma mahonii]WKX02187.1 hypothetical protein O3I44_02170 [Candidatus Mycoplasma mahonii]